MTCAEGLDFSAFQVMRRGQGSKIQDQVYTCRVENKNHACHKWQLLVHVANICTFTFYLENVCGTTYISYKLRTKNIFEAYFSSPQYQLC